MDFTTTFEFKLKLEIKKNKKRKRKRDKNLTWADSLLFSPLHRLPCAAQLSTPPPPPARAPHMWGSTGRRGARPLASLLHGSHASYAASSRPRCDQAPHCALGSTGQCIPHLRNGRIRDFRHRAAGTGGEVGR
jgi:hypothetical protein